MTGLRRDCTIRLTGYKPSRLYPENFRIVEFYDAENDECLRFITNNFDISALEVPNIYRSRRQIEVLIKQMKQNFPLKYFYGESANAIKIQIWVTLIANLLLMVMQKRLTRSWSFSGLATMVRITPMYYVDFYSLFNHTEKDWKWLLEAASEIPRQPSLFD